MKLSLRKVALLLPNSDGNLQVFPGLTCMTDVDEGISYVTGNPANIDENGINKRTGMRAWRLFYKTLKSLEAAELRAVEFDEADNQKLGKFSEEANKQIAEGLVY